jgi:hypothetical protein
LILRSQKKSGEGKMKRTLSLLTVLSILVAGTAIANQGGKAKNVVNNQMKTINDAQASQKKIDKLAEQTSTMLAQYRQTLKQIDNAKAYIGQLNKIIASQESEKVSIAEQIKELKETNAGVVPLMIDMVDNLKAFVSLDIPFLQEERSKRLADLDSAMNRADITTSEKFRRILEAYQVENEFGRTIEAYRGVQKRDGKDLTVDYLRVGRTALIYQSLDAKITALWDAKAKTWTDLDGSFKKSVREGLKMARKQTAPQLVKLPVSAAGGTL